MSNWIHVLFLKAATLALLEYPFVNLVIHGSNIFRRNFIDISVTFATPNRLPVPDLRNCLNMIYHDFQVVSYAGLRDFLNWSKREKRAKLHHKISNAVHLRYQTEGPSVLFLELPSQTPSKCYPRNARFINRPVIRGDEIAARPIMNLALTYDHRPLDGKDAVIFLKRTQTLVQNPKKMLFEV